MRHLQLIENQYVDEFGNEFENMYELTYTIDNQTVTEELSHSEVDAKLSFWKKCL